MADKAKSLENRSDFSGALESWEEVLILDSENEIAQSGKKRVLGIEKLQTDYEEQKSKLEDELSGLKAKFAETKKSYEALLADLEIEKMRTELPELPERLASVEREYKSVYIAKPALPFMQSGWRNKLADVEDKINKIKLTIASHERDLQEFFDLETKYKEEKSVLDHLLHITIYDFETDFKVSKNLLELSIKKNLRAEKFESKDYEIFIEPTTVMEFVKIPGGSFMMGSPEDENGRVDDEFQHKVALDGFWMGKYPVTQGQWQKLMDNNPSNDQRGEDHPVTNVSWGDCEEFIDKLNSKSDLEFRLPAEAEWEYACRAGTTGPFYFGEAINADQVNCAYDNFDYGSTTPVGSFPANAYGLYDMHGNVWEWCLDWYDSGYYKKSTLKNPKGPSIEEFLCADKVLRGGCVRNFPAGVRSACRFYGGYEMASSDEGFRLVFSKRGWRGKVDN